jgi:hypothetical protein
MTDAAKETMFSVLEKYGFPVLVSLALGFFLREDVVRPLVSEHAAFLRSIAETQREIAKAVSEQTRLLYALQPRAGENQEN